MASSETEMNPKVENVIGAGNDRADASVHRYVYLYGKDRVLVLR